MLLLAVLVGGLLPVGGVLLLRSFLLPWTGAESPDAADLSWRAYIPIQRLLDPADLDYLRRRGVSAAQIRKVRAERRRIFRICLRSMAADFHRLQKRLEFLLAESASEREELRAELVRHRLAFYRALCKAEGALLLHACGFDCVPDVDLLEPLQRVQARLREVAPAEILAAV